MKNQFAICHFVPLLSTLLLAFVSSMQAVEDTEKAVQSTAKTLVEDAEAMV